MPRVDAQKKAEWYQTGWGCSCPAWRSLPTKEQVRNAFMRAPTVTVEMVGQTSSEVSFIAYTNEPRYDVMLMKGGTSGICKHVVACMGTIQPWAAQLAEQIAEDQARQKEVEKEWQKARKQLEKLSSE